MVCLFISIFAVRLVALWLNHGVHECVREKQLNFFHLWKVVFKHCSVNETLIVQAGICVAESRFVLFNFTFGG